MTLFVFPPVSVSVIGVAQETTLQSIEGTVEDIASDVAGIEADVGSIETTLQSIEGTVEDIASDVAGIEADVGSIETTAAAISGFLDTRLAGSLVPTSYDKISAAYPDANTEVYSYYLDSVLVRTLTVTNIAGVFSEVVAS